MQPLSHCGGGQSAEAGRLSLHATPLSIPLFDNYLLCCLGQGWGHHTYITDTKTLATRVCPPPFDLFRPLALIYTQNTQDYRTTRQSNHMVVSQVLLLGEANTCSVQILQALVDRSYSALSYSCFTRCIVSWLKCWWTSKWTLYPVCPSVRCPGRHQEPTFNMVCYGSREWQYLCESGHSIRTWNVNDNVNCLPYICLF